MSSSKVYPQIPTAQPDLASLVTSVNALKQMVEIMVGIRAQAGTLNSITLASTPPAIPKTGDGWVTPVGKIYFWNGTQWIAGSTA